MGIPTAFLYIVPNILWSEYCFSCYPLQKMKIPMKKSILIVIITVAISAISFVNTKPSANANPVDTTIVAVRDSVVSNAAAIAQISNALFNELRLDEKGLSIHALELAVKGYLELKE